MEGVYPILSGALAQEKRLELITNNLANVNTSGFKKDRAVFEGLIASQSGAEGFASTIHGPSPAFARLKETATDFSSGNIMSTGEPLDVAISGEGFFSVQTPEGVRYTRNGHFSLDSEGQMVTLSGFPVLGSGGPITLPDGEVIIESDGRISVAGTAPGAAPVEVDFLSLTSFSDPSTLEKRGNTLFEAVRGGETLVIDARFKQGALEGSNVNPVEEMVAMVEVMRLYESAQKAIQTADNIAGKQSNEIGRLA